MPNGTGVDGIAASNHPVLISDPFPQKHCHIRIKLVDKGFTFLRGYLAQTVAEFAQGLIAVGFSAFWSTLAMLHGAKADPRKRIECDVDCKREGMVIVVRDPGNGFDPGKIPSPISGENIFCSHGRGIYLIQQLMDEVRFHKNGTEIHMVKR